MLRYLIPLMLMSSAALAQQYSPRAQPHGYMGAVPDGIGGSSAPLAAPVPSAPLLSGPLTAEEIGLIAKALDRMKVELAADPKTVEAADRFKQALLEAPYATLADIRALPTIGLALGRATNVEVDRIDEHGVAVIDNIASREASKPYCDLLKKINPQAGCTKW